MKKVLKSLDDPAWFVEWSSGGDGENKDGKMVVIAPTYNKAYKSALDRINNIADCPTWVSINLSVV